ncbi:YegS/Rv2252/BmrU family lipid kinase [Wenzhouxiangella sp. XN201]|uniref:diacylglycerol/lipid kinase family protein n=1 Tax=Wenzhouxiangella sp. XN201 TaxID=2710755 RepID=UPI0013C6F304|nr:YegS/Rv2252/BmrU family lipid kinase [Wenzhouxiangella sp. XN201]NEZ04696.1 YegS/Rv2252/BmrU family lipid kinase [Wenzhouxiangella sp. XN201]
MSGSTLLLTNPGSRSGDGDIDQAAERLQDGGRVEVIRPDKPQELPDAIRERAREFDRIVLGGGDGTINLALDALLDVDIPVGILPLGTANDLARSLGIPGKVDGAVDVILAGHLCRLDAGRANDVSFINAIGIGMGPQMTREMDPESKAQLGVLAYLKGIVEVLQRKHVFHARIESEERSDEGEYMQITIANGIHYGGGMTIADDAKLDDGRLDVLLVPKQSHLSLLGNAHRFRTGVTRPSDTLVHWRCSEISIETGTPMDVTADGEILTRTPVKCRVIPSCLSIYAPR